MSNLNKYIALFLLENFKEESMEFSVRNDLEREININKLENLSDLLNELNDDEIGEYFYQFYNNDIIFIDSILHKLHLEDKTLRDKTNMIINVILNNDILFNTKIREHYLSNTEVENVKNILKESNINWYTLVTHTYMHNHEDVQQGYDWEYVIIKVPSTDKEKVNSLKNIFPDGEADTF